MVLDYLEVVFLKGVGVCCQVFVFKFYLVQFDMYIKINKMFWLMNFRYNNMYVVLVFNFVENKIFFVIINVNYYQFMYIFIYIL